MKVGEKGKVKYAINVMDNVPNVYFRTLQIFFSNKTESKNTFSIHKFAIRGIYNIRSKLTFFLIFLIIDVQIKGGKSDELHVAILFCGFSHFCSNSLQNVDHHEGI
jgi:hypothetical protein